MAQAQTLSGEVVTITETKGSDVSNRHWFTVVGLVQGVIDFLNENKIPQSNVMGMAMVTTTMTVLYHK